MNVLIKLSKIAGSLLLALSVLMFALCGFFYTRTSKFIQTSHKAQGKVVELQESRSDNGTVFHPVYTFVDRSGAEQKIYSSMGSYPPAYQVGDAVNVLYDPQNPRSAEIEGFWSLWLVPLILGIIGAGQAVFGLLAFFLSPFLIRLIGQNLGARRQLN